MGNSYLTELHNLATAMLTVHRYPPLAPSSKLGPPETQPTAAPMQCTRIQKNHTEARHQAVHEISSLGHEKVARNEYGFPLLKQVVPWRL